MVWTTWPDADLSFIFGFTLLQSKKYSKTSLSLIIFNLCIIGNKQARWTSCPVVLETNTFYQFVLLWVLATEKASQSKLGHILACSFIWVTSLHLKKDISFFDNMKICKWIFLSMTCFSKFLIQTTNKPYCSINDAIFHTHVMLHKNMIASRPKANQFLQRYVCQRASSKYFYVKIGN